MVSPRDQYLVINRKIIEASESPSGNKIVIIGARSHDFEEHPENDGIVRASSHITGYYIEQLGEEKCNVHFVIETDYGIPLWI